MSEKVDSAILCMDDIPGYTVITRSMSANIPTWSVIAVEGVSGEMATPAFIFLLWMAFMSESGLAVRALREQKANVMYTRDTDRLLRYENSTLRHLRPRCHLPTVENSLSDTSVTQSGKKRYPFWFGNHHMTVHEYSRDTFRDAGKDWCT
jgi:hypothetical protein